MQANQVNREFTYYIHAFKGIAILHQLHYANTLTMSNLALRALPISTTASLQAPRDASSQSSGTPRFGTNPIAVDPKPTSPPIPAPIRRQAFV